MMNIEYIRSEEIESSSQLNDILDYGVGILIDGRIYTSIDSILEVDYLNARYNFVTIQLCANEDDSDNEVKTPEFQRIGELAYAIRFPNQQS